MAVKIYTVGCSITAGAGFVLGKQDPEIYPNLLAARYTATCMNDAEGGASNFKIFLRAAKAMIDLTADVYVIQWSAVHRHWMYPAPNQGVFVGTPSESDQHKQFVTQFQRLNHDYGNVMNVIDFTRILQQQARTKPCAICFVNGLMDWTHDLLDRTQQSDYARQLFSGLDHAQTQDHADRLADNLELVDWDVWANAWNSVANSMIDHAALDHHPGPGTHAILAAAIESVIDTQQGHP